MVLEIDLDKSNGKRDEAYKRNRLNYRKAENLKKYLFWMHELGEIYESRGTRETITSSWKHLEQES